MTSAIILFIMAALLTGLRNGFYALHFLITCGAVYLYERSHMPAAVFSAEALWVFLVVHLVSINLVTFVAYGYDKSAAKAGKWRVREKTLHAMSFVGGTFGAFAAQKIFRHKTRKSSFRIAFWLVSLLQVIVAYTLWVASQ